MLKKKSLLVSPDQQIQKIFFIILNSANRKSKCPVNIEKSTNEGSLSADKRYFYKDDIDGRSHGILKCEISEMLI